MLVLGIAIVTAALIPLLTGGSYARLFRMEIHWTWLLGLGLAIQLGLEYVTMPREYWHSWGYGLLVASYVLILAFCSRNLVKRGMGIVLLGIACNALVIGLNQGMPVKLPAGYADKTIAITTVKHHLQTPGEQLLILSDIIILKRPYDVVMSFGDLILAVGLCDVAYHASRNPRKRRKKKKRAGEPLSRTAANDYITKSGLLSSEKDDAPLEPIYVAREPDPRLEAHDVRYEPVDDLFSSRSRSSRR
jgi:Family of unknown function (DUF5317)